MTRRRSLIDHGLIFAAALLTLPLAFLIGDAVWPILGGAVIVGGAWVAIAATLRLASVTALVPTILAMATLLVATLATLARSERPSSCPPGQTGFMDCGVLFETAAVPAVLFFIVLSVVLCFLQSLATPRTGAARERRPLSARLPMDEAWRRRDRNLADEPDARRP